MRALLLSLLAGGVAGCALPSPGQAKRAASAHDSRSGPDPEAGSLRGILVTGAPGDDAASPLRCRQMGPDTNCTRDR